VVAPEGSDIPGKGLVESRLPDWMVGDKGRAVRQKALDAFDLSFRARTGAAAPPAESEKFEQQVEGWKTEEEFRRGVEMLFRGNNAIREQHRARFGAPAVRQLEQQRQEVQRDKSAKPQVEKY
jgi:hypothetical protein